MNNDRYDKQPIILASGSPRRAELLERVGVSFEVFPASSEKCPDGLPPAERVLALSRGKCEEVAAHFPGRTVVGADTMVVLDDEALGKPKNRDDAVEMLLRLSGRTHRVMTGVWVISPAGAEGFVDTAEVEFYPLTRAEAERYADTGEPLDKAGAYGIQGLGMRFVKGIRGDYYNVMGLPVARLLRLPALQNEG